MKIGDLVLDTVIDEMGIIVEIRTNKVIGAVHRFYVVQLADDSCVLSVERDLELVSTGSI